MTDELRVASCELRDRNSGRAAESPGVLPNSHLATRLSRSAQLVQYAAAWLVLKGLGLLPRRAALAVGRAVGRVAYHVAGGLRRTGYRNLGLAFPQLGGAERRRILTAAFEGLGRQLGAFSQLPRSRPDDGLVEIRNLDALDRALAGGRGVLFLTAHVGGWELSPFYLRLNGYPPVSFLVRRLDNPLVERLVDRYRTLCGNRSIDKRDAARPVLAALRRGEMVGILTDINVQEREGVFVDFFGRQASTTTGIARFALRTGAAVVPGFMPWDARAGRYVLVFGEPVALVRTGSAEEDLRVNTQRFTKVVEDFVRAHPDQWLWVHKRWKTRPLGEPGLY
jgi:KDO2-lipid IV(A) lauroyltransferase